MPRRGREITCPSAMQHRDMRPRSGVFRQTLEGDDGKCRDGGAKVVVPPKRIRERVPDTSCRSRSVRAERPGARNGALEHALAVFPCLGNGITGIGADQLLEHARSDGIVAERDADMAAATVLDHG